MADEGLGQERSRLRGKSKVKNPVAKQDDAASKRSLSVWLFGISFEEIAMALFKEVEEVLIEEIMFCFTKHTGRVIFLKDGMKTHKV